MIKKILFVLHLPPPVHGSAMVGQYIKDSKIINTSFNGNYINLSTSRRLDEIGKNPLVKIYRYLKIISKVIIKLLKYKPEIVYLAITAKGIGFYKDFPIALLTKLFGKKLVLHYHNKGVSCYQNKILDNFFYKILFKNTKVILLSERLYDDVSKYVSPADVFYCANGIPDHASPKNIKKEVNEIPKLLFLSNLIESKGVFILLDALKLLKDQGLPFFCNFVGGEGDINSEEFNSKLKNLNLQDCVSYLGKKYNVEKYEIFQSSDVFVFPTFYDYETFGLVNLEAMMFGLPVISTNEGGIPDIVIDNETGFIVRRKNSQDLADKIKFLIENPEKSKMLGEKGRLKFYESYTIEVFEKRLKNVLNKV